MRGGRHLWLALVLALAVSPVRTQPLAEPPSDEDLSIQAFLLAVEAAISTMEPARWMALLSPSADREHAVDFFGAMVPNGVTRAVIKERDRAALAGTLPGEGFRLITEVFIETGLRGRIATWRLDIRRPRGEDTDRQPWRVVAMDRLSSIEGLHRLELHPEKQFTAQGLVLKSVDFEVRLPSGQVFVAETSEGITALVLLGDGSILFTPAPKEEKGQVRLLTGSDQLDTSFTSAFLRVSPFEFDALVSASMLAPEPRRDARALRRAQEMFDEEVVNSFSLDLSDLSRDTWSLLPQPGEFVAEVRTRRYDRLTYARSTGEPEDVSLFQRERRRNISVYASEQKLASRGQFYDEDDLIEYDVVDYAVDATFLPDREWLEGVTRLRLRVRAFALAAVTLRLAEPLTVSSVVSDELGRLLFLRVRNQNAIVVNLPSPVGRDFTLTLNVAYRGRLDQQRIEDESLGLDPQSSRAGTYPREDQPIVVAEPKWLFSSRAHWYPQAQVTDFATGTLRINVPSEYTVIGSGVPDLGSPLVQGAAHGVAGGHAQFRFTITQPVRYMSMVVSKLTRVDAATVALDIVPPAAPAKASGRPPAIPAVGARNTIELAIDANRRQEGRGRDLLPTVAEILRLYAAMIGDVPYDSLTVAMVESDLPGGHAPGYVAILNNALPTSPFTWRNDPASFPSFPEFFLAHEVAHQWFGQAVGWKNYHEQWLSEGFAQYLAALYARERRGEQVFRDVLKQFRRWAIDESSQGPVYLGYRLGHIKGESRVFRALVYNKGAAVLHMLRRLIGDEAFFRGLRRYYAANRFKKAGTDDLRSAMEAESGRSLERFFARWIFDVGIPRLRYSTTVVGQEVVVRIEQNGELYDLPVTVTIQQTDGRVIEDVVLVTEDTVEARVPITGAVRSIELNQDNAALALFDRSRG
jgi:hypothetical protein